MRKGYAKHVISVALRDALNDIPAPARFRDPVAQKLYNEQRAFFAKRFNDVITEGK